jgi:hypothetical protein
MRYAGKVAFALGTGRCGTYLAHELMKRDVSVASSHERSILSAAFHRYCVWYGLPVDDEAFIRTKAAEIDADLARRQLSFEASAPLSLSVPLLYREFDARFVLFVRNPVDVVNSYLSKGWFKEEIYWRDDGRAPGYHPAHEHPHHSFGRLMPMGDEFAAWARLGRIGKLAWTWAMVNRRISKDFGALPPSHTMTVRLEDFDYGAYQRLTGFLGRAPALDRQAFDSLTRSRPNRREHKPTVAQWSARDATEFTEQIGTAAVEFGYEPDLSLAGTAHGLDSAMSPPSQTDARRKSAQRAARALRSAIAAFRGELARESDRSKS